jgi:hypothetical protein
VTSTAAFANVDINDVELQVSIDSTMLDRRMNTFANATSIVFTIPPPSALGGSEDSS